MKRTIKRLLALALCLALLSGALPARAAGVQYDLFITDVRVTEENRADILGDGVFRFDGERTLVVRGDCDSPELPVISTAVPGLIVRVQTPSRLTCGENPAVLALADLTVTGPAALSLESTTNCGVFARNCSLTVRNISLIVSGRWGLAGDEITDENGRLRVVSADIDASGTDGAICDFARGIELEGCAVEAPADHVLGDHAVKTSDLRIARQALICCDGRIPAPEPYIHTVTFLNTRGEDPAPQTVEDGRCARSPALDDAAFGGWCADPECRTPFDFSTPITENTVLYSAWTDAAGQADKTVLDAALRDAGALSPADYSETSWQMLQAVLAQAMTVAADEDADQREIDAAIRSVRAAVAALAPKPAQIDRSVLEQVVAAAEALDPSAYTEESQAVLRATLEAARAALGAGDQAVADAVARALIAAMDTLEEQPCEPPFRFEDVQNENAFYFDAVYWAYSAQPQITNGTDATHFGPDNPCTRGHVVTFLWRAAGCPAPRSAQTPFRDLKAGAFYETAVAWAVEQGVTKGISDDRFGPNAPCTRGQIVTFLWRFRGSPAPKNAGTVFTDVPDEAFCAEAVAWAVETGVTKGMSDAAFAPDAPCTRGQVVTFLSRDAE